MCHVVLASYGLFGEYIDREHLIRVGDLNRRIIRLDELRLGMMIRHGGENSRIISWRQISVRLWAMDRMKVGLVLWDRGQEIWLGTGRAGVNTFRLFRCYRRIRIVKGWRIAYRGARARYIRRFSKRGLNRKASGSRLNGFLHVVLVNMAAFSIALLVGPSLHASSTLFPLRIDAIIRDAIFDAAKTRTGIVTLLAGLLTIRAGILDLTTLCADKRLLLGWSEGVRERIDVHRHL